MYFHKYTTYNSCAEITRTTNVAPYTDLTLNIVTEQQRTEVIHLQAAVKLDRLKRRFYVLLKKRVYFSEVLVVGSSSVERPTDGKRASCQVGVRFRRRDAISLSEKEPKVCRRFRSRRCLVENGGNVAEVWIVENGADVSIGSVKVADQRPWRNTASERRWCVHLTELRLVRGEIINAVVEISEHENKYNSIS